MGVTLGHGAWQIDRPSNGSITQCETRTVSNLLAHEWACRSLHQGAEGCCGYLNALFTMFLSLYHHEIFRSYYH